MVSVVREGSMGGQEMPVVARRLMVMDGMPAWGLLKQRCI
jgi:hypothetical protein